MKRIIRLGDPTSHGGTVLSASSQVTMFGKPVARIGDVVACPQPGHSNCVIVEGDPTWLIDGKNVALEGHMTSCGAVLISTLGEVTRDYKSSVASAAAMTATLATAATAFAPKFDEQIRFFTADSNVLADTPYKLTLGDGTEIEGKTDADGKTQRIATEREAAIVCAEFFPDTFYGCACAAENVCAGGRAPTPALKAELSGIKTNGNAVGSSVVNHTLPASTTTRGMTPGEIAMARTVFKDAIEYSKVKIHKGGLLGLPNLSKNAMTPKGEIYFPEDEYLEDFSVDDRWGIKTWFIHEMAHVWQYQLGYNVVFGGIQLSLKGGYSNDKNPRYEVPPSYRYNLQGQDKGKTLPDFNMEQQADLIAHYFSASQIGAPRYRSELPQLELALKNFIENPNNKNLLPKTTQVENNP